MSEDNGVGDIYNLLVERLSIIFNGKNTTRSSIAFVGPMNGSRNTIFSLIPKDSNSEDGLKFQVYINRLAKYLDVDKERLVEVLPQDKREWGFVGYSSPEWTGYEGYFKNIDEAEHLTETLSEMKRPENG